MLVWLREFRWRQRGGKAIARRDKRLWRQEFSYRSPREPTYQSDL